MTAITETLSVSTSTVIRKLKEFEFKSDLNHLPERFGVDASGLRYMTRLIERYGIEIIKKGKNRYYSPELKQEMIDKVLLEDRSQQSVCLDYGLSN